MPGLSTRRDLEWRLRFRSDDCVQFDRGRLLAENGRIRGLHRNCTRDTIWWVASNLLVQKDISSQEADCFHRSEHGSIRVVACTRVSGVLLQEYENITVLQQSRRCQDSIYKDHEQVHKYCAVSRIGRHSGAGQQLPTQELNKLLRPQNQADEINALRIMILHAISFKRCS